MTPTGRFEINYPLAELGKNWQYRFTHYAAGGGDGGGDGGGCGGN